MNTGCPSPIPDEILERYAMGRLPDPDLALLDEHLLICPTCQTNLEEIDQYITVMKAATAAVGPRVSKHADAGSIRPAGVLDFQRPAWVAGFAALVLLVTPFYPEKVEAVTLTATRGAFSPPQAQAGQVLLKFDVTGIQQPNGYRLEVVDGAGRPIWHASVQAAKDQLLVAGPKRFKPGRFWIRLYDAGWPGALLREYGLEINPSH